MHIAFDFELNSTRIYIQLTVRARRMQIGAQAQRALELNGGARAIRRMEPGQRVAVPCYHIIGVQRRGAFGRNCADAAITNRCRP